MAGEENPNTPQKPRSKDNANHLCGMAPSDNKWIAVEKKETITSTDSRKKKI